MGINKFTIKLENDKKILYKSIDTLNLIKLDFKNLY